MLVAGNFGTPLWAANPSPSGDGAASEKLLLGLRSLDQKVATVGYRLATANVGLCPRTAPLGGIVVHDLSEYGPDFREAAAKAFGLESGPGVLAVAADSAAARAGVEPNDILETIDGAPVIATAHDTDSSSFDAADRLTTRLESAFSDGIAVLRLSRNGHPLTFAIHGVPGCAYRFQVKPSDELNAKADGEYVQVTSGLVAYARDDAELAAVLAHELAHNILRHRERLDEAGVSRGLFKSLGRNARLIRETEEEADRLSVYLLDRAGYPAEAAPRFWERFGREHGLGIFASATHPRWKQRVAALKTEILRLASLKKSGGEPIPPLLAAPLPSLK